MPAPKPATLSEISEIQQRMALIRRDMHQEVQSAVKGAQFLTDWRSLIKTYPWASLAGAALAGYLIVPRPRSVSPTIVAFGGQKPEVLAANSPRAEVNDRPRPRWKVLGAAFGLLAPVAARAAQNYALGYLENWLSQHPLPSSPQPGPPDRAPRESGRSGSAGSTNRLREFG